MRRRLVGRGPSESLRDRARDWYWHEVACLPSATICRKSSAGPATNRNGIGCAPAAGGRLSPAEFTALTCRPPLVEEVFEAVFERLHSGGGNEVVGLTRCLA